LTSNPFAMHTINFQQHSLRILSSLVVLASILFIVTGFLQPSLPTSRPFPHISIIPHNPNVVLHCAFQSNNNNNNNNNDQEYVGIDDESLFQSIIENKDKDDNTAGGGKGAGVPRESLGPEDVAPLLMNALQNNNIPETDAGIVSMWEFSSDMTKFVFKNNATGEQVHS